MEDTTSSHDNNRFDKVILPFILIVFCGLIVFAYIPWNDTTEELSAGEAEHVENVIEEIELGDLIEMNDGTVWRVQGISAYGISIQTDFSATGSYRVFHSRQYEEFIGRVRRIVHPDDQDFDAYAGRLLRDTID